MPRLIELADDDDEAFFQPLSATQRSDLVELLQRLTARARSVTHDTKPITSDTKKIDS